MHKMHNFFHGELKKQILQFFHTRFPQLIYEKHKEPPINGTVRGDPDYILVNRSTSGNPLSGAPVYHPWIL